MRLRMSAEISNSRENIRQWGVEDGFSSPLPESIIILFREKLGLKY